MTRTTYARRRTTGRLIAAGGLSLPLALVMIGPAASTEPIAGESTTLAANDAGRTCDKLGYTKIDSESGSEALAGGAVKLVWSGRTLTYTIQAGYTVELCVKGGSTLPIATFTRMSSGSYTHPQGISHIGYVVTTTPTTPPPTTPPPTTPPPTTPPPTTPPPTTPPGNPPTTPPGNPPSQTPPTTPPGNPGTPIGGGGGGGGTAPTPTPSTPAVTPGTPVVVPTPTPTPIAGRPTPAPGRGTAVPTASPTSLPRTGATSSLLLALGAGLLIAGGGLAYGARREQDAS